jgi:hypothetical protein
MSGYYLYSKLLRSGVSRHIGTGGMRDRVTGVLKYCRQLLQQSAASNCDRDSVLKKERTNLIDNSRPLADQLVSHSMDRLQIHLFDPANRNEAHRRSLNSLGNGRGVVEVVLVRLQIRFHEARCDELYVMTGIQEPTRQVLRTSARLHAD